MNEAKYTKGPWSINYNNCDNGTCQWYEVGPAKIELSYHINLEQEIEWKSNARLISAAPDLLEALQELTDLFEATMRGEYEPDSFTTQPANTAISKALGSQS